MVKEQIETIFSKEELGMLQLIMLDRKCYFMNQINHCLLRMNKLKSDEKEDTHLYNSYELSLQTYRLKLNAVDKFYEFLIK